MKKLITLLVLMIAATSFAFPSAYNRRTTFDNAHQWTGNARDNATLWAQGIEGEVVAGGNLGTGNVYYVDSNVSSEGDGSSWTDAVDTLDEAINLCTANNGDLIKVAQGHAETWTASTTAATADINGIVISGAGIGDNLPIFTFSTASLSNDIDITGDVEFRNLRFVASSQTGLSGAFDVNGAVARFVGCQFLDSDPTDWTHNWIVSDASSTVEVVGAFNQTSLTAGQLAASSTFVTLVGGSNHKFIGNSSAGTYTSGNVLASGTTDGVLFTGNNFVTNSITSGTSGVPRNITIGTNMDGWAGNNMLVIPFQTGVNASRTWINPQGSLTIGENYGSWVGATQSILVNEASPITTYHFGDVN
jgi:hypothetical protein